MIIWTIEWITTKCLCDLIGDSESITIVQHWESIYTFHIYCVIIDRKNLSCISTPLFQYVVVRKYFAYNKSVFFFFFIVQFYFFPQKSTLSNHFSFHIIIVVVLIINRLFLDLQAFEEKEKQKIKLFDDILHCNKAE